MTTTTAPALTALTGTYTLDPAHTRIGFVARHAMVTKVRGAFNDFEGTAVLDGANPANSRGQVTIRPPASTPATPSVTSTCAATTSWRWTNTRRSRSSPPAPARSTRRLRAHRRPDRQGRDQHVTIPFSTRARPRTRSATRGSASKARSRSTARTTASPGTPPSRPAASWSATRSPWSSRSPRSRTPDPPVRCREGAEMTTTLTPQSTSGGPASGPRPASAGWTPSTPSPSAATTTRPTPTTGCCWSTTTTRSTRAPASRPIRTATWRSSPGCCRARWSTRTPTATPGSSTRAWPSG